jgi:iron complex transport system ATP-binding protein
MSSSELISSATIAQRPIVSPHDFNPIEDSVVHMSRVSVHRGQNQLLDDVSWHVQEGERWIVMGPNGAGKSTLINIAAARSHPTSGNVSILGEVLGAVDVFDLRPSIGLSSTLLAEQVPGGETIRNLVVTAAYGVTGRWREEYDPEDLARADQLLARWGIAGYSNRRFRTLSEGERKRALIARAMMTDPEMLILDEPGAGLDLAGRETLVRSLSRLATDPFAPTPILVTHHVEEIPPNFTHALLLRDGQIISAGPIDAALTEETLSEAFRLPLNVSRNAEGRFTAFART